MSLLQGLLGFGAGAAGAFAEQKKADVEAQRRANLARLQAQYKGEVQMQQAEKIAEMGMSDDPAQRATAAVLGHSPKEATLDYSASDIINVQDASGNVKSVNINDPGVMSKIRSGQLTRVSTQKPSEVYTTYTTELGNTIRQNTQTGKKEILIGNDYVPYTGPEQEARISPALPEGELDIPTTSPQERLGFSGEIAEEAKKPVGELSPTDYLEADITNTAGGIADFVAPRLAGVPIIGQAATAIVPEMGKRQQLSTRIIQRLSNQILSEEAQKLLGDTESPRLTNLMIGLAEKAASLDAGLISTPQSVANSVSAAQTVLENELAMKNRIAQSPEVSSDQRVAARKFLTTFEPVNDAFENILAVHSIRDIAAPSPTTGETKNLREFSKNDLKDAVTAYKNNPNLYDATQLRGLSILAKIYGYE